MKHDSLSEVRACSLAGGGDLLSRLLPVDSVDILETFPKRSGLQEEGWLVVSSSWRDRSGG